MSFLDMLQLPFMQHALWVALLLSVCCALLSCFLVLKGWALLADAIAHASLLGVAVAHLYGLPMILGAASSGLSCALLTAWLEQRSILRSDTLLGIVFSTLFAAGIVLSEQAQHLNHLLMGHILGISAAQRWQILLVCVVIMLLLAWKWRDLLLFVFDPVQARLSALSIPFLYALLIGMLTALSVVAMQAVGVILVVAMLIAPALSAQLVVKRFSHLLILASCLAALAAVAGVSLAFYWNSSVSATIVLCQAVLFLLMLLWRNIVLHNRILFWAHHE